MSSALLALKHKYISRPVHHKAISIALPWKTMYVLALVLTVLMLGLYIYRVNQLTQGAYLIKNNTKEIKNLVVQNAKLQTNFEQTSFLSGVQQKAVGLGFEKTAAVSYVQVVQGTLAEAR